MKRKIYNIKITKGNEIIHESTKFAWNTARSNIPKIIKELLKEGETAKCIYDYHNVDFTNGNQIWKIDSKSFFNVVIEKIEVKQ